MRRTRRPSKDKLLGLLALLVILSTYAAVAALDRHNTMAAERRRAAEEAVSVVKVSAPVLDDQAIKLAEDEPITAPEEDAADSEDAADPDEDIAIPDAEPDENEKIKAALLEKGTQLNEVKITHYCICKKCCGKEPDHPAYGITASGNRATPGVTVAVDPKVIPLGSEVFVDYGDGDIQAYIAQDTGGSIKGNRLDLCVEDHQTAINLGVRTATVWFIPPEETGNG